jgi:hypothetical protein
MKKQGYNYNIFIATHQKDDNILQNLIRKIYFFKNIEILFKKYKIDGATISKNIGFYEGKKEKSYLISIITDQSKDVIIDLCQELRAINNQDSVLLQVINENILIFKNYIKKI